MKKYESPLDKSLPEHKTSGFSPARKLLLALLGKLRHGSLLLVENDSEYLFGEPRQQADIQATIVVRSGSVYGQVLRRGSLGAAQAYMQGDWETPDLLQVTRLFVRNLDLLGGIDRGSGGLYRFGARVFHALRRNTRERARQNISEHYDLSNDFFRLFLDPTMAYSAAIFADGCEDLEAASNSKFRHICERLQLEPGDHLLEIGTGWGGLAVYAARHFGCRVTTTTLSAEQAGYARDWIEREGLADRITVLEQDYRELDPQQGRYDKLVSIEMIEAVGAEYYREYFRRCSDLLKPEGLMLIQAITISDQRYAASLKNTDFIKRYIFPGGQLPCNAVIASHVAADTDMQLVGLEDMTLDYARTLRHWRDNFHAALAEVRRLGFDENFIRMWRYYLCYCEGGFLERAIHTGQFLLAKPGFRKLRRLR